MSKLCLYLTFAIVLCLFSATSFANPKPDIDIIINTDNKAGAMPKMPKIHTGRLKKLMKGTMATNIYTKALSKQEGPNACWDACFLFILFLISISCLLLK